MRNRLFLPCMAAAVVIAPALAVPAAAAQRDARGSVPTNKSARFAGYKIHTKRSDTISLSATIEVPKLTCGKGSNSAIAPSAGFYQDSKTNVSSAGLFIGCVNGKARYFPSLMVNNHRSNLESTEAHPGDMVTLELSANSGGETSVEVFDVTHPFDKSRTGAGFNSFVANPWAGDMKWSTKQGLESVPNFGTVNFSTATVDGDPFGSLTPLVRFNMYNKTKTTLQVKTGNLGSTGNSFKTIFKHS